MYIYNFTNRPQVRGGRLPENMRPPSSAVYIILTAGEKSIVSVIIIIYYNICSSADVTI